MRRQIAIAAVAIFTQATLSQEVTLDWSALTSGAELGLSGGEYQGYGTAGFGQGELMQGGEYQMVGGFWNPIISTACIGDLDGNRQVTLQDLANLLAHFGQAGNVTYSDGDIDGNGQVTLQDLAYLLANFGVSCPI